MDYGQAIQEAIITLQKAGEALWPPQTQHAPRSRPTTPQLDYHLEAWKTDDDVVHVNTVNRETVDRIRRILRADGYNVHITQREYTDI